MIETKLKVDGMHCSGCENRIKNVLSAISDVNEVRADYKTGEVVIKAKSEIDMNIIKEKIEDLGFEVNS